MIKKATDILRRYLIIDSMLSSGLFPTKSDIKSEIEKSFKVIISDSLLEKDFFAMRNEFRAPIVYSKIGVGYHYNKEFTLMTEISKALGSKVSFDRSMTTLAPPVRVVKKVITDASTLCATKRTIYADLRKHTESLEHCDDRLFRIKMLEEIDNKILELEN